MLTELVETTTGDGLTLHGACYEPPDGTAPVLPFDAVLLLHGVGSNFYSSTLLTYLARRFCEHGARALSVNTRGHDFISLARTAAGPQRQGAAYETVGQCHRDVNAWNDFLVRRGAHRVAVVGHSLGAVKAVYSAAFHPHASTMVVVALSPPRLSYQAFRSGPRRILFERTMARARSHLTQGKPETLIRVKYPFPLLITAAGYVEKYGPSEEYNLLRFANQLPCPALFTFGQQELESGSAAFTGLPESLRNLPSNGQPLESLTIADANHLYDGRREQLAHQILRWLGNPGTDGRRGTIGQT